MSTVAAGEDDSSWLDHLTSVIVLLSFVRIISISKLVLFGKVNDPNGRSIMLHMHFFIQSGARFSICLRTSARQNAILHLNDWNNTFIKIKRLCLFVAYKRQQSKITRKGILFNCFGFDMEVKIRCYNF